MRARWSSLPGTWSTATITSGAWSTPWTISEVLDDTLVIYIIGDNGGAPESGLTGSHEHLHPLQRGRGIGDSGR